MRCHQPRPLSQCEYPEQRPALCTWAQSDNTQTLYSGAGRVRSSPVKAEKVEGKSSYRKLPSADLLTHHRSVPSYSAGSTHQRSCQLFPGPFSKLHSLWASQSHQTLPLHLVHLHLKSSSPQGRIL